MKILLFGKNGQLGRELKPRLEAVGEVVAPDRESTDFCGDLCDLEGIANTVLESRADVVVNAAAYTDVDAAETAAGQARVVNALAPGAMAKAADRNHAWMLHFSTDYVFDGSGERAWSELDEAKPLNVYGQTKLEGDRLVAQNCGKHLILRTSWLYSLHGRNFPKSVLARARQSRHLDVVDDQIGSPTDAAWLADMALLALGRAMNRPGLGGIYNLAAAGHISRHDFAVFMLGCAQRAGFTLQLGPDAVKAVSSTGHAGAARRPLNSRLDTSKFQAAFDVTLPRWQPGVEALVRGLE